MAHIEDIRLAPHCTQIFRVPSDVLSDPSPAVRRTNYPKTSCGLGHLGTSESILST